MKSQKKIVHITTIDEGGAYKAVERMHKGLQLQGLDSHILLRDKIQTDNSGEVFLDNPIKKLRSKSKNLLNLFFSHQDIAYECFGSNVVKHPLIKEADIIVVHWCNSFLSYASLDKLFKSGKKIVFFMHDTWLFTGGCHVNLECDKYKSGCGNCPYIKGDKKKDLSYTNFTTKKKLLCPYPIHVAGPSKWIIGCASKSAITKDKELVYLPNCINGDIFKPYDAGRQLKEKYGIPLDKKVILFGAAFNGAQNKNKGFQYLLDSLKYLPKEEYHLVVFGNCEKKDICWDQEYTLLGYIRSEEKMAEVYNLADVYVTPSLQESFGFTVCEAMACGTPVVAFPVGGIKEQITHKKNGYLSKYKDAKDIAEGIKFCTETEGVQILSKEAATSAERFYTGNVSKQYKEYFDTL